MDLVNKIGTSVLLSVFYFLGAIVSYKLVIPQTQSEVFWIPTGLTFALFLRARRTPRLWAGWLAAIFITEFVLVRYYKGLPQSVALSWSAANALHPLICATLAWKYLRGTFDMSRMRDVPILVLLIVAGGVPSAFLAAFTARFGMEVPSISGFAAAWGISDALGVLLFAPLILSRTTAPSRRLGHPIEAGLFFSVLTVLCAAAFFRAERGATDLSIPTLLFLMTAWGAVRFGARAATLSVLIVNGSMVWAVAQNRSPLVTFGLSPESQLLNMQILIIGSVLISLLLASFISEEESRRTGHAAQALP